MRVPIRWGIGVLMLLIVVAAGCLAADDTSAMSSSEPYVEPVAESKEHLPCGGAPCTMDEECGHGLCNKTECVCAEGWTNSTCDYHRKSQKSAFFYGFFLGYWGGGRLYLRLIGSGVVQLLFCVLCVIELIVMCIVDDDDICEIIFKTLGVLMTATVIIWWLVDVILIGTNHFLDGTGVFPVKNL